MNTFPKTFHKPDKSNSTIDVALSQIYMAACSVYSLEDKIQQLEAQVGDIHEDISDSNMSALEDEVANAMARVAHSENEVSRHSRFLFFCCLSSFYWFLSADCGHAGVASKGFS